MGVSCRGRDRDRGIGSKESRIVGRKSGEVEGGRKRNGEINLNDWGKL
jgi:hypothetical protein